MRGNPSDGTYPDDWTSRSKKIKNRDGFRCQNCGVLGGDSGSAELHTHHIVPKSEGGTHRESNLVTLCWDCHNRVHSNYVPKASGNSEKGGVRSENHPQTMAIELSHEKEVKIKDCHVCGSHLTAAVDQWELYCMVCRTTLRREEVDERGLIDELVSSPNWTVVTSDYDITGSSMMPATWHRVSQTTMDSDEELERKVRLSSDYAQAFQKRTRRVLWAFAISILPISMSIFTGNVNLAGLSIAVVLVFILISGISVTRDDRDWREEVPG